MMPLPKNLRALALVAMAVALVTTAAQAEIEVYTTSLSGTNEVPPNGSTADGTASLTVDTVTLEATYALQFSGLSSTQTGAHFHNAPAGANGPVVFGLPVGSPVGGTWSMLQSDYDLLVAGSIYINVHSLEFPGGEIRGQMVFENVGTESTTLGAVKSLFR